MGEFYKTPHFPIWVIGSSSHYTILFCPDPRIVQDSEEEALYKRAQRAFKVRYNMHTSPLLPLSLSSMDG